MLTTRLPVHSTGLIGCILVFRNEETATWAGGETTEAGDPEGQKLEFAATTLYLGNPVPPPPSATISAWSSEGPSERRGRGTRGWCVCSSFQLIDHELVPAHQKLLLGFGETIPPKYEQMVPSPPEV